MPIRNQVLFYFRAFLIALLMMTGRFADAASIREVSMDEMLQQSQFVFEGMVTGVETAKSTQQRIHTYVTFEIMEIIKGEYSYSTITLRFLGGTVDDVTMVVSDMRLPQEGERGIYFVESLERFQVNPFYGWSQGHFIVERDDAGIERVTTNKRLPVRGVMDYMPDQLMTSGEERKQALSKGIVRDLVVGYEGESDTAMTVGEFKRVLYKKLGNPK